MEFENPFYWWITNPGINFLLSLVFSAIAFIGVIYFVVNLVFLSSSERNKGKHIIGILFSLLVIGFCLRWEWFLIFIGNVSSLLTKGIGDILMQAVYYWYLYSFEEKVNLTLTSLIV
ncbi:MAG: hypothetical protein QXN15_00610 [Candidatus Jordarchaeales archaeon]|nr:hypothetical protein [Candidatus Jordarchaeia archaeon]